MNKEEYRIYLQSDHWKKLRLLKISQVGYKCQDCGVQKNIQVHHIRYKKIYNVKTNDLRVLCRDCHIKYHENTSFKKNKVKTFNKKHKRKRINTKQKKLIADKRHKNYLYLTLKRLGVPPLQILKELSKI